jgi:hypothetical protein
VQLYGERFDLISDPFCFGDNCVLVDALERRSGPQEMCPYSTEHRASGRRSSQRHLYVTFSECVKTRAGKLMSGTAFSGETRICPFEQTRREDGNNS